MSGEAVVVVEPGWQPGDFDAEQAEKKFWDAARLYEQVVSGGPIEPVATSLRLEPGESAYADTTMEYSRFYGEDKAIRNSDSAEPRWREAHATRVVFTDRRLVISVDACWRSFPHDSIAEFLPDIQVFSMALTLFESVPLRLRAPDLPARAVLLASFLYPPRELAQIPDFAVLA